MQPRSAASGRLLLTLVTLLAASTAAAQSVRSVSSGDRGVPSQEGQGVVIEVLYSPDCQHCLDFIRLAVIELIEAKLPGDLVRLTVLPLPFNVLPPRDCRENPSCYGDLAPLCAMKATRPHPTPADSPALLPAVKFLVCDLRASIGIRETSASIIKDCATEAGLPWQPLENCARSQEVFDIMYGHDYSHSVPVAIDRLAAQGFRQGRLYAMPLVFINGDLLQCTGNGCTAVRTPKGARPLPNPGTLLELACARLHPAPAACAKAHNPARPLQTGPAPPCENCDEVGSFEWHSAHRVFLASPLLLGLAGAAFLLSTALAFACRRRFRGELHDYGVALRAEPKLEDAACTLEEATQ